MSHKKTLIGEYHKETPALNSENRHTEPSKNFSAERLAGINFDCPLTDQINKRNKERTPPNGVKTCTHKPTQPPHPVTSANTVTPHTPASRDPLTIPAFARTSSPPKACSSPKPKTSNSTSVQASGAVTSLKHNHVMSDRKHDALAADDRRRTQNRTSSSSHARAPRPSSSASLSSSVGSGERKSSPLDFDKNQRVEPYRDPELLKRDQMQRFAALHTPSSAAVSTALASMRGLPPVPAMPTITGAGALPPLPAIPASLHPFAGLDPLTMLQLSQIQQHQMQLLQDPHLAAAYSNPYLAQLELMRQKNPQRPLPPDWMTHPDLLRDPSAAAYRDLMERIERDRELREREAAREQELREREMRERREELERLERK